MKRTLNGGALLAVSLMGLAAFLLPTLEGVPSTRAEYSLLLAAAVVAAAAVLLALALWTHRLSTRLLAVLAALAAIDAALRLAVVTGIGGFSPVFFLILAGGFALGPSFGFALGALTLLLSAGLTAGVGPWLPYQMLAAGWVGMGAGLAGRPFSGRPPTPLALGVLAAFGFAAGFAYGVLLDIWEWPFLLGGGGSSFSWAPGLPFPVLLQRFATFYVATSAVYDAFRAAGNGALVLLLGGPAVAALVRFRRRFLVVWEPAAGKIADDAGGAGAAQSPIPA